MKTSRSYRHICLMAITHGSLIEIDQSETVKNKELLKIPIINRRGKEMEFVLRVRE